MRFLFTVHHPVFGGPHNQALRLAGPLRERGWEQLVLVPRESGNATERLSGGSIETVEMPMHRLRQTFDPRPHLGLAVSFAREIAAIRQIIRERSIDLVVVAGLINPHAALAAKIEHVPVVWQVLDTRAPMLLRRLMMPLVRALADSVMTTGMLVARQHPGATALGDRLVPYFPPVDTQEFKGSAQRRAAARDLLGVAPEMLLAGMVGNLNPQKGHEYLVEGAAAVRRTLRDARFVILGATTPTHTGYHRELVRRVAELGLGEYLKFHDPGPRVADLLPALDVFVLASVPRSEGIPTVILEAMSCGVPVVATDVGGVREVVDDGVTGLVVPPLNAGAIATATLRLLRDDALRARMGEEGRRRAVERYDIARCADVHVRAFELAIAHHATRRGGP